MKDCKYRLPCDWCDKFNKKCDEIDYYKPSKSKKECDHMWIYDKSIIHTAGQNAYYHCFKCGATKLETYDLEGNYVCEYESSNEWQT